MGIQVKGGRERAFSVEEPVSTALSVTVGLLPAHRASREHSDDDDGDSDTIRVIIMDTVFKLSDSRGDREFCTRYFPLEIIH